MDHDPCMLCNTRPDRDKLSYKSCQGLPLNLLHIKATWSNVDCPIKENWNYRTSQLDPLNTSRQMVDLVPG